MPGSCQELLPFIQAPVMEKQILEIFARPNTQPMDVSQLLAKLKLPRSQYGRVERVLVQLEKRGAIARIKKDNRYALPQEADLVPGRIRMRRQGTGTLQPDDPRQPVIIVPPDATGTAMHGDHVLVRIDVAPRPQRKTTGEVTGRVVRVLEAARKQLVGTLQQGHHFWFVVPDDPRITQDIIVPPAKDTGRPARVGDKVVVELKSWLHRNVNPEGEIVEVLGPPDAEGVDMLSVLRNYDLPLHFPKPVLREAHAIGTEINPADIAGRIDCRKHPVITIDPIDAKDFDDAICLERIDGNRWKAWVHIADVSHYVRPGSALDVEAARRGNSTYLADRVIPMLPEALSNELCSLKPNVDRFTKCVEFLLSDSGQVLRTQFYPSVIHSKRRYHYREALEVLQREPRDEIEKMLHHANRLAQSIRKARFAAGALDLDFPEMKLLLDENGKVKSIDRVENDISHQLVEEFMLLANEAVAARLISLNRPALHRSHEPPDERKLQEFREEVVSHFIPCGNLNHRPEVQKLLHRLGSLPIGQALKVGFLRSLMRARYTIEPLGHYGLAKKKYTHFTSPIRRYADLVVHRALFQKPGQSITTDSLPMVANHISETERNSDDAERDSRDVKLFAFLNGQLRSGQRQAYDAYITDVRNFGFFVDVTGLGMSGLVPASTITDDFYAFQPERAQLVGRRTRRVFKLGDKMKVQVSKVDTFKRQVDFELAEAAPKSKNLKQKEFQKPTSKPAPFEKRPGGNRQKSWQRPTKRRR